MSIEVILTQDDPKLGKRGQVVKVSPGYAQNFLFPHHKAQAATAETLKVYREEAERRARADAERLEKAKADAEKLKSITLTIEMQVAESSSKMFGPGHESTKLYGAVTSHEIADALARKGIKVERKNIHLAEPIKKLGAFEVPVKLHRDVTVSLRLSVMKKS